MGQNTSTAVLQAVSTMTGGTLPTKDPLDAAGSCVFDDKVQPGWLNFWLLKRVSPTCVAAKLMLETSCHVSQVMAEKLPAAVLKRFQDCLISGAPTTEEDQKIIADTLYEWASRLQSRQEKRKE